MSRCRLHLVRSLLVSTLAGLSLSCRADATDDAADPVETVVSATAASTTPPVTDALSSSTVNTEVPSPPLGGQPDCAGGTAILETVVLDSALVIRESTDGHIYCIEDATYGGTFGSIPSEPSPIVALNSSGHYGRAWYQFMIPADFPSNVTVYDEDGVQLPAARGRAGEYLVVIDPLVGQQGPSGPPTLVARTLDVRDDTGASVATLAFQGFGESEFASFEQFMACVRDAGVDMAVPPAPGATTLPREPSSPDALRQAWTSCSDLVFSYMAATQQSSPEFLESMRFEMNCVADAGFYPMLNEPHSDLAAFEAADANCRALTPGRTAVVECLRNNGLEVVIDGAQSVGPYPPEIAERAWQACRDLFALRELPSPLVVADRMPPMDCMAAKGWLTAFLKPTDFADPQLVADRELCMAG